MNTKFLHIALGSILLMIYATSVLGAEADGLKATLTRDIEAIVNAIDQNAKVILDIKSPKPIDLPGTPFSVSQFNLDALQQDGSSNIVVTIYTSISELETESKQHIESYLEPYSKNPMITFVKIHALKAPPEIVPNAPSADTAKQVGKDQDKTMLQSESALDKILLNADTLTNLKLGFFSFGAFCGLMLLIAVARLFLDVRFHRRALTDINQGLSQVAASLQQSPSVIEASAHSATGQLRALNTPALTIGDGGIKDLPEDSIGALLTDCYWAMNDQYGAFVWRRVSIAMKQSLMQKIDFLSDYGTYLTSKEEVNLGLDQDPAYLRPLPIWPLDMTAVTNIVVANPVVLRSLSRIRIDALNLPPKQMLEIEKIASSKTDAPNASMFKHAPSNPRALAVKSTITIKSIADEEELLTLADSIELGAKRSIPSLVWLFDLPNDRVEKILEQFSARDLASAWIGPEKVLQKLETLLAPRKSALLKSSLETTKPSRSSPVFKMIHQEALKDIATEPVGVKNSKAPEDLNHAAA